VVVVPEAAERVLEYGVPPNRIVIVSNTEDAETFCRGEAATHGEVGGSIPWVAGYVGGIGPHRGIDTALRSMPIVVAEAPHARMRLVGANDDARRVLTTEAEHLGVRGHVEVEGWRPFGDMEGIIRSCDVCLVPHNDFEHTQTTVPHKLFQYMLCRRPVLVSDVRPLARIVRETGAGLVFGAGDSDDCAAKMLELLRHPDAAARMGRLGRAAATSGYAWRHDAERLVAMFASLEREMRAKRS
jgi:glycosyltransferase involved in cell wall biosynthesis